MTLLAVLLLGAACDVLAPESREAPEHGAATPHPAEPDAPQPPPEPPPPRGAVLSVVTAVGSGAAAATLDRVGFIRLRLIDGAGAETTLDVPTGGSGILHVDPVAATGNIWVELWSPAGERVGGNSVAVDGLPGSIGVFGLELGIGGRRACLRCSAPEPLSEVRGLFDTMLLWSASSEVVTGDPAERLHVATRLRLSGEVRRALVEAAGGRTESETADDEARLVWSVVAPERAADVLEVALRLARHPEVKALERYEAGRSGRLYEPPVPEALGTGLGTGVD